MIPAPDVYGQAMADYYYEQHTDTLWVHTSYGTREEMPVEWFFRQPDEFPEVEQYALSLCRGTVLDIGAGVGAHALALQHQGHKVLAVERSAYCSDIMKARGVRQVLTLPYVEYSGPPVDTMMLLMNGIGLVGTLGGLGEFLEWSKRWLTPGGQLLFDSSDVSYLFDEETAPRSYYYGEIQFQYEYREQFGEWFSWLYVDEKTLLDAAAAHGWFAQLAYQEPSGQHLYRLQAT